MGSGRAVGNQVECRPVPVFLLRGLVGVGPAAAVEDGADGLDVGLVGRLGEFEREQHRQVFELERVVGFMPASAGWSASTTTSSSAPT